MALQPFLIFRTRVARSTVIQEDTPPHLIGRVVGAFLAFAQAAFPFGAVIAGFAIERAVLQLRVFEPVAS